MERYPRTDKEKNCRQEREKRNWLRQQYFNELEKLKQKDAIGFEVRYMSNSLLDN